MISCNLKPVTLKAHCVCAFMCVCAIFKDKVIFFMNIHMPTVDKINNCSDYVMFISQYEWVILVITRVQGKAEDKGNN